MSAQTTRRLRRYESGLIVRILVALLVPFCLAAQGVAAALPVSVFTAPVSEDCNEEAPAELESTESSHKCPRVRIVLPERRLAVLFGSSRVERNRPSLPQQFPVRGAHLIGSGINMHC